MTRPIICFQSNTAHPEFDDLNEQSIYLEALEETSKKEIDKNVTINEL